MAPKTVKPNGRGASAPQASKSTKKSAKRTKTKRSAAKRSGTHYIRNLHNGAGGARIDLTDGTRIQLAPRGQVGDLVLVNEEMTQDPMYQRNVGIIFQELTSAEGQSVIDKQNINAQAPRAGVLEHLTNEKGQKYTQTKPTIEAPFESQGQVVGRVEQDTEGTSSTHVGEITRQVLGPPEVQVPGSREVASNFNPNVMPSGLSMEQAAEYMNTPPEQRMDLLSRWQADNNELYRDSLNVTIEPTQRG